MEAIFYETLCAVRIFKMLILHASWTQTLFFFFFRRNDVTPLYHLNPFQTFSSHLPAIFQFQILDIPLQSTVHFYGHTQHVCKRWPKNNERNNKMERNLPFAIGSIAINTTINTTFMMIGRFVDAILILMQMGMRRMMRRMGAMWPVSVCMAMMSMMAKLMRWMWLVNGASILCRVSIVTVNETAFVVWTRTTAAVVRRKYSCCFLWLC